MVPYSGCRCFSKFENGKVKFKDVKDRVHHFLVLMTNDPASIFFAKSTPSVQELSSIPSFHCVPNARAIAVISPSLALYIFAGSN